MTTTNAETVPAVTSSFATSAIACFTYALLTIIVLHVLRPDHAPASHMISDYGVGPYAWVMTTWFVATSCGCLMLLLGLSRSGLNAITARLGVLLLGIASIGLLISAVFPTDLVIRLGQQDMLTRSCTDAGFENVKHRRITTTLVYADANEACDAVFVAGPVALAWSRFSDEVRARARACYLESIDPWRLGDGYRIPGEFVIAAGVAPAQPSVAGKALSLS